MKSFLVGFNCVAAVKAENELEAREIFDRHLKKSSLAPGIMNASWCCVNPHKTLIGVSCKTIYPDGSVSDSVPFPCPVDDGSPQCGQTK